jgi:hypothetical protein
VVSLLLERGANIEAKNKVPAFAGFRLFGIIMLITTVTPSIVQNNSTPLHLAAYNGHKEVVSLLLERGANIEAKDKVSNLCYLTFDFPPIPQKLSSISCAHVLTLNATFLPDSAFYVLLSGGYSVDFCGGKGLQGRCKTVSGERGEGNCEV